MPATGYWLLAQRLTTTILFKLLRLLFITAQHIFWHFSGTAQKRREAQLRHNYRRIAHVLDVVLSHQFCKTLNITLGVFLCTHNRFEDSQYIIDNDNITLMMIDDSYAVFCEPEEKGTQLWRAKYSAFVQLR